MAGTELAQISTGITIAFGSSGFVAEILDVTPPQLSRESVDTTHMATTKARTFSPVDLYDAGESTFDFHFEPATDPPIDEAKETVTITFPDATTWTFEGFMTGYEPSAPLEDKMTGSATLKVSGEITIDPQGAGTGSSSFNP